MSDFLDLSHFKTSSIGTTVESGDDELSVDYNFSSIGWLFITFFGTTQTPTKITFTCKKSEEVFEVLMDKEKIKYYMLYMKR